MTTQCLSEIKESFIDFEKQEENKNIEPKRKSVEQPWDGFSEQIAEEYRNVKISHRAYNRQIAGYLHKDTLYGPAVIYERYKKDDEKKGIKKGEIKKDEDGNPKLKKGMYIKSIPATGIKPNHLRMPDGWDKLKEEYKKASTRKQKKAIRRRMTALEDVPPAKSGVIRDIDLRDKIRDWLKDHNFKDMKEAKKYIKENGLIINGTPVRKVRVLWKLKEVKEIPRKTFNLETGEIEKDTKRKSLRVYQTQNNHHIEIREKINRKGDVKWTGEVITNFDAAKRVRIDKKQIVNKNENGNGKFVMSLARGEMVYMKDPETDKTNYFVVFKIDSSKTIHLTPHTDANPAKEKNGKKRKEIPIKPDKTKDNEGLRQLIIYNQDDVPEKVKISALGEVRVLVND
jgi:hypothetical protein